MDDCAHSHEWPPPRHPRQQGPRQPAVSQHRPCGAGTVPSSIAAAQPNPAGRDLQGRATVFAGPQGAGGDLRSISNTRDEVRREGSIRRQGSEGPCAGPGEDRAAQRAGSPKGSRSPPQNWNNQHRAAGPVSVRVPSPGSMPSSMKRGYTLSAAGHRRRAGPGELGVPLSRDGPSSVLGRACHPQALTRSPFLAPAKQTHSEVASWDSVWGLSTAAAYQSLDWMETPGRTARVHTHLALPVGRGLGPAPAWGPRPGAARRRS